MKDLASLDFKVRDATEAASNEKRAELRIASTGAFVAWFRSTVRMSDGEAVVGTTTQFIRRKELTPEQIFFVENWLREQYLAATLTSA